MSTAGRELEGQTDSLFIACEEGVRVVVTLAMNSRPEDGM